MRKGLECVPGTHVTMFLVGLTDHVTDGSQQAVLGIRHVDNEFPARLQNSKKLLGKIGVGANMFEKIHDDDAIELVVFKWGFLAVDLKYMIPNQITDRADSFLVQ